MALVRHIRIEAVERTAVGGGKGIVLIDLHDASVVAQYGFLADMDVAYGVIVVVRRQQHMAVHLDLHLSRVDQFERIGRKWLQLVLFRGYEAFLAGVWTSLHTCLVVFQHSLCQGLVEFLYRKERHLAQLGVYPVVDTADA